MVKPCGSPGDAVFSIYLWGCSHFPSQRRWLVQVGRSMLSHSLCCAGWLLERCVFSVANTAEVELSPPGVLISPISVCALKALDVCGWVQLRKQEYQVPPDCT